MKGPSGPSGKTSATSGYPQPHHEAQGPRQAGSGNPRKQRNSTPSLPSQVNKAEGLPSRQGSPSVGTDCFSLTEAGLPHHTILSPTPSHQVQEGLEQGPRSHRGPLGAAFSASFASEAEAVLKTAQPCQPNHTDLWYHRSLPSAGKCAFFTMAAK